MTTLRHLIFTLLLFCGLAQAAKAESYFQYPIVPDSISTLEGRCNYLADHFWDFCDLTKGFSARAKMGEEFKVYLSVLENATPARAAAGLKNLMQRLDKQPKDQLYFANIAESRLYSDTAEAWIDYLYLPVAETVAANKKLNKAEKARYALHADLLRGSMVGEPIVPLTFTCIDGSTSDLHAKPVAATVIFFNDPECSDCNLARIRLHADISTSQLIDEGRLRIVSISVVEPDEEWKKAATAYPETWTVGANPDADLKVDLRFGTPDFYILDKNNKIRFKHLSVDQVLDVARQLKKR